MGECLLEHKALSLGTTKRRHSMKYYAGLDISMKETFICILSEDGQRVYESHTYTDPKHIYDELHKSGYELDKVGIESGSLSGYLTKGLQTLGCRAICIDSRKMAAILSVTVNKTDKNDARGIADAIRCNHYKETRVRNDIDEAITILLKSRTTLVNSRRVLKNTMRGHLKIYGIRLGTVSNKRFPESVRSYYSKLFPEAKEGIESLLKTYEALSIEIEGMEKSINKVCKQDKEVQLLMTAPGVGKIVALTFKTDIGDPSRFKKSECGSLLWDGSSPIFFRGDGTSGRNIEMRSKRSTHSSYGIWCYVAHKI